ncbi:iron complex outermembrane recepter protein [Moraxella cuniculi DSM 21768]|uniref:Iron complex outermembrane recepter protein n=1 Tax=Moraxella cuniculi DSM 21768 TaxID=1122245 RepID=A0A1N7EJV5_9GAMM|nr:TonB-dependent siderophore receptor [Moraxella cuniculi]OOS07221.1 hypothetical protein B0189_03405 [Moraxella cuniculi]SIR88383.1 iron complex outermembrane recepter protein [Moraxella cuniculi DSM 21768]
MQKTLLNTAIGAVLFSTSAPVLANTTPDQNIPSVTLATEIVVVSADASSSGLKPAYAGGQIAKGSRVGILGNKDYMDTPFSTTAYTQNYIKDKQANSVGDVLKNDPTVTVARGYGNFQEAYLMRGFVTYSDDTMYNGLYGILPRQYTSSEMFERIELQRGASTALNGISPGGANTGGTITLLPKRASNNPKREVSVAYQTDSQVKISTDIGRRFGENNQFGVRTNVAVAKGDGVVKNEEKKLGLATVGLDYRGKNTRLSADVGYQDITDTAKRSSVDVNQAGKIPNPVDANTNWSQPWTNTRSKDLFATVRAEQDLSENMTAYAAYGFRNGKEYNVLGGGFLYMNDKASNDGSAYYTSFDNNREDNVQTGELGLKGRFYTGKLSHDWTVAANTYRHDEKNATVWDWQNRQATNIYNPVLSEQKPQLSTSVWQSGDLNNPAKTAKTKLDSVAIANTVSALNGNLQATLGARYQQIQSEDITWQTMYDDKKISPVAAINYRFGDWSVFANYSEKLTAGKQVKIDQRSLMLKPYVSKQSEVGMKYDGGNIGATFAIFNIKEPRAALANGTVDTAGNNVHQGVEILVFGRPAENLRLISGMTLLDAKQKNTNDIFDGKQVIGTARLRATAGVEYEVKAVDGLSLTGDIAYTDSRYANADNSLKVGDYTLLNLGASYRTNLGNTDVTLRGTVENATNKKHWASVGGYPGQGYLVAGEPRTLKLSATFGF